MLGGGARGNVVSTPNLHHSAAPRRNVLPPNRLRVSAAGPIGAAGIQTVGGHDLGLIGAALIVVAVVVANLATRPIHAAKSPSSPSSPS
jgi:hypothetical protein